MPQYSVLEVVLIDNPDFNNQDVLAKKIAKRAMRIANEIQSYVKSIG